MNRCLIVSLFIVAHVTTVSGQNYFKDPSFDEPTAPHNSTSLPCGDRGETFDTYSKIYFRADKVGSPDIVVPAEEDCKLHIKDSLIKSQCLGMAFGRNPFSNYSIFKEPVFTKLNRPLAMGETYEISFDILCNPIFLARNPNTTYYETSYFTVILKSSSSSFSDTLTIPVSANSYFGWDRSKLVFASKSEFDVVQFDYLSDEFFGSDARLYLYTYLDNFELVSTAEKSTTEQEDVRVESLLSSKELVYYFDSDQERLSAADQARLLSDLQLISLQGVKSVKIFAFTDNKSTVEYNRLLSERRAKNIQEVLQGQFTDSSITYIAEGKGIDANEQGENARRVEIEVEYQKTEVAPWYRTSNNPLSGDQLLYIGEVAKAHATLKLQDTLSIDDSFCQRPIQCYDAINYIKSMSEKHQIIVINEAHNQPSHRAFIRELLPELQQVGYGSLACELMYDSKNLDSLIYYEYTLANMLKAAKRMGYELISYDTKSSLPVPVGELLEASVEIDYIDGYEHMNTSMNTRDYNQFVNLKEHLDQGKKIIIHVGMGHASLYQRSDWKPLGAYLKEAYGDKVLSIDQQLLNDVAYGGVNEYTSICETTSRSVVPCVDGKPCKVKEYDFLIGRKKSFFDMHILHGASSETKLYSNFVNVGSLAQEEFPVLVLVYEAGVDVKSTIPIFIKEVATPHEAVGVGGGVQHGDQLVIKSKTNQIVYYGIYEE